MIKIYYNADKTKVSPYSVTFDISGEYLKAEVVDILSNSSLGYDIIKTMTPYNSYGLVGHKDGIVKVYRRTLKSDFRFLDYCKLGMSNKMDFELITQLYGEMTLLQVDTGIIADTKKDIVIMCYGISDPNNIQIETEDEYTVEAYDFSQTQFKNPNRFDLWDSYSLTIDSREVKANCRGEIQDGDFETLLKADKDGAITFTIQKYKGNFESKLTRDIDNEEVFVDCSAGLIDNRRVRLVNGVGTFRLLTFGYKGYIKLKLGRKWYRIWNDYALNVE